MRVRLVVGMFVVESVPFEAHSAGELLPPSLVKFNWPTTTSAGCCVWVGMEFQIKTRSWPKSDTNSRCPSDVTDTGEKRLFAVGARSITVSGTVVLRFGSPNT